MRIVKVMVLLFALSSVAVGGKGRLVISANTQREVPVPDFDTFHGEDQGGEEFELLHASIGIGQMQTEGARKPTWTAGQFWTWFKSNDGQKLTRMLKFKGNSTTKKAALEFSQVFHRANPELSWEIHFTKNAPLAVFTVSGDGLKENAVAV